MSKDQVSVQAQLRTHAATHARALAINGKGRIREETKISSFTGFTFPTRTRVSCHFITNETHRMIPDAFLIRIAGTHDVIWEALSLFGVRVRCVARAHMTKEASARTNTNRLGSRVLGCDWAEGGDSSRHD